MIVNRWVKDLILIKYSDEKEECSSIIWFCSMSTDDINSIQNSKSEIDN